MKRWSLRLLGAFSLESVPAGGRLRLGRKPQALLAYLAVQGSTGAPRARLAGLLWPDSSEAEARAALRQCLHMLRRQFGADGDALVSDGERVALRAGACDVDAAQFENLATREEVPSLRNAVQLYRGDFVESVDIGAEFGRWAAGERERLREVAHRLLERLSKEANDPATREDATRLAYLLLAGDPVHEGSYRALMRLYSGAGLSAKALQTFNECREALRRELGIEPSAQTAALVGQLCSARAEVPPPAGAAAVATAPSPLPHVPAVSASRPGDDPRVIDLNLRGWESFTSYTPEGNRAARSAFEEAASLAGDHAQVIARAGWTYWTEAVSGWTSDPDDVMDRAWHWASRALACNRGRCSTPHSLMGKILLWRRRHDEALQQLRTGASLEPAYAWPHFHLGDGLMWSGQCDESLAEIGRALELDQNDHGMFLTIRGLALWQMGELQAARAALESAVTRNPTYAWAHLAIAVVHFEQGDRAKARAATIAAQRLHPSFSLASIDKVLPFRLDEPRRRQREALQASGMRADRMPT